MIISFPQLAQVALKDFLGGRLFRFFRAKFLLLLAIYSPSPGLSLSRLTNVVSSSHHAKRDVGFLACSGSLPLRFQDF